MSSQPHPHRSIAAIACALAMAAAGDAAQAVVRSHVTLVTAPGLCQAALPSFEGLIRKRPLAIQNEGATTAFVGCSLPTQGDITGATVYLSSIDGAAHTVSCTGVSGYASNVATPSYAAKTISVAANGAPQGAFWSTADFGGGARFPYYYFSLQCALPPGVGMNDLELRYNEETQT